MVWHSPISSEVTHQVTHQDHLLWCSQISSEATRPVHPVHQVWHSPISSDSSHQVHSVHQVWRSQISSVCFMKRDFHKCSVHWSPLRLLQMHRSLISTATSTSAPFTNLHCCVATVAPSCSESPFISYYFVWLCYPTFKWLCNYAAHQQPCYWCEYACWIFICIIEISVLATIQILLPPVDAFILQLSFSSIT